MVRVSLRERTRYWFDNTMSRGTPALVGWLALASAVLVLVVASMAWVIARDDVKGNGHWSGVVWRSLLRTLDPGTMGGDVGSPSYLGMMLVATVGGILIVSALIGVLTTGLEKKLTELRKGRSRIVEHDHTVLLGWSDQVFTVIEELVEANQSGKRSCVAVLADRDKVDMDDEIRIRVGDTGKTRVVCRHGDPLKVADLELVSPGNARSIIVLSPHADDPDIHVIKTLLSLNARHWDDERPHVVAAVHDSANLPAAQLAGGEHAQVIDANDIAVRLIVQSHRQSGVSAVCAELLDFEGHEFYLRPEPSLAGRTFGEALHGYSRGIPVGLWHPDGSHRLNPPSPTVIGEGDELILLAEDDVLIKRDDRPAPIVEDMISVGRSAQPGPDRTLVLGWNPRAATIIGMLDGFARPGSLLRIAARCADPRASIPPLSHLEVGFTRCDDTARAELEALDVLSYQSIIILADDCGELQHADARTLVTLLHLRDLSPSEDKPFTVVVELNDDANREIAQITEAEDFIVSEKLINQMLTQLSESPRLHAVFATLLHPEGPEIYLKPATDYLRPGGTATFATVIEAARRRGEIALGYRLRAQFHRSPDYGVKLNPSRSDPLELGPHDLVIVLAEA